MSNHRQGAPGDDDGVGVMFVWLLVMLFCVGVPFGIGYASIVSGLGALVVLGVFTALAFNEPPTNRVAEWFCGNKPLGAVLVVATGFLIATGTVSGVEARRTEAAAEVQRQREAAEARTVRAELDAAAMQRRASVAEAEARQGAEQARLALVEARRPPSERAALALARLSGPGDSTERYCGARVLLDPVPAAWREAPTVRPAFRALRQAEREALREQSEAYDEGRGLLCRDGDLSPTCTCHGSHRGCCSWHGGVRGCEPLPDEVSCPSP
ncbi:MAG: hypothetical protein ACEQSX_01565 [Baekduiaceae bacterium]